MKSYRDYVRDTLTWKLIEDVNYIRIFNEADMQYRAAHHLDKVCYPQDHYLTNQPNIPVGIGRGKNYVKPDIVVFHHSNGPIAAFELKCFLSGSVNISTIIDSVWNDIEKLHGFKTRYSDSKYCFAMVLLNIQDKYAFGDIKHELCRDKDEWMKHYLFTHVLNIYCTDNGHKRPWYDKWFGEFTSWQEHLNEL